MAKEKDSGRNPHWTTDELILALDLYLKNPLFPPSKTSKELIELSDLLNRLNIHSQIKRRASYRNPNGVYMKLMNFRRLDPNYTSNGKVGLQRGGKQDELVWNKFINNPKQLSQLAQTIRQTINFGKVNQSFWKPEGFYEEVALEGKMLSVSHIKRERNRGLVEQRKKQFFKKHGRLFCEVCNFDFSERYGERGIGFIECHHTKPLHTLKPNSKTRASDLILLCSNCHRMIHAKRDWLTVAELKEILRIE